MPHNLTKIEIQKIQKDIKRHKFFNFKTEGQFISFSLRLQLKTKTYVSYVFLNLLYLPFKRVCSIIIGQGRVHVAHLGRERKHPQRRLWGYAVCAILLKIMRNGLSILGLGVPTLAVKEILKRIDKLYAAALLIQLHGLLLGDILQGRIHLGRIDALETHSVKFGKSSVIWPVRIRHSAAT